MTTKQTIDGVLVSRELIERILNRTRWHGDPLKEELRALLDAPTAEVDPIVGVLERCLSEGVQPTFSGGDLKHLIRLLESKPAAQPEGEPVAFRYAYLDGRLSDWYNATPKDICYALEDVKHGIYARIDFAYSEQPAPVVHTMKSVMEYICSIDGFPILTSNQCHALAVKLNA